MRLTNRPFPEEFCRPVRVQRMRFRVLRCRPRSIEDVIRRDVDEGRPHLLRAPGELSGRRVVHVLRFVRVRLATVDIGYRGCVEYQIRPDAADQRADRGCISDVEAVPLDSLVLGGVATAVGRDHMVPAPKRLLAEVLSEEPRPSHIEDARHVVRIEERAKTLSR